MTPGALAPAGADLRALKPLLTRLNDCKRMRGADEPRRSLAQRGFVRAWGQLCAGDAPAAVALCEAAACAAAVELGPIDAAALRSGGMAERDIADVLRKAVDKATAGLAPALRERLLDAASALAAQPALPRELPAFARRLQDQPRAGATHPTAPRLILEPAESHADHCYVVAVGAVLVAGQTGAEVADPFLAGLAHHLHNAVLPDGGFAGEALLGEHLQPLMERLRDDALHELPPALAEATRRACLLVAHADGPAAQAFQAADVIDRVVEAAYFERVARYRLADALGPLGLVHAGPLKPFQDRVLAALGFSA